MDEVIEAMALAMEKSLAWDIENDVYAGEMTHEERRKVATAAYNAIRAKLVPVGWMYEHPDGYVLFDDEPMDEELPVNWRCMNLYALPEIDNG